MNELNILKEYANKYTVLCVEDSKALLTQEIKFLKKVFKEVYTASDGKEGLEVFKTHKPKIVITDLNMPNMNGFDMIRALKKIDSSIQIIIISAYTDNDTLMESIHIGVSDFVKKPIEMETLHKALAKSVDQLLKNEETLQADEFDIEYDNEVINTLAKIKKLDAEIQLVNNYRGLPIIHNGVIKHVNDDTVVISTKQIQNLAVKYEGKTTIASDTFPGEIEATYKNCDDISSDIFLTNLKFVDASLRKREFVRVEIDKGFYVILQTKDRRNNVAASVIDISVKSIKVKITTNTNISKNDEFYLVMDFQYTHKTLYHEYKHNDKIGTKASVFKVEILNNETYVIFLLDLSSHDEKILSNFIYHRELELIEEFKMITSKNI